MEEEIGTQLIIYYIEENSSKNDNLLLIFIKFLNL